MEGSVEKKDLRCVAGGAPKAGGPAPVAGAQLLLLFLLNTSYSLDLVKVIRKMVLLLS